MRGEIKLLLGLGLPAVAVLGYVKSKSLAADLPVVPPEVQKLHDASPWVNARQAPHPIGQRTDAAYNSQLAVYDKVALPAVPSVRALPTMNNISAIPALKEVEDPEYIRQLYKEMLNIPGYKPRPNSAFNAVKMAGAADLYILNTYLKRR